MVNSRGYSLVAVHGILTVVVSLVAEHGLYLQGLQQLWFPGPSMQASEVVAHRLGCLAAHGTYLDKGSNPRPQH